MRLINADELKADLHKWFPQASLEGIEAKTLFAQILADIDNTPTVELFCSYLSDGEVRQPCVEGPCEQERPQGDLISRSELKKAFNKWWGCDDIPTTIVEDIIDNAPTVEPTENSAIQYSLGYQDGFLEGKKMNERQQGDLADEVWKLYRKHQSHLATHVLEFGCELKELLGKY